MAEVVTKKSINVVSNKKNDVQCSVQSNNGLLDLDNITTSNSQLISLCESNDDEDDLILTNNTRNELDNDDKSLQELIESELALRICSSNEEEMMLDTGEQEESANQPDTVKRIVLSRRQDTIDANAELIAAEVQHCSLIEEPYSYRNGHVSPDTNISSSSYGENPKPDPIAADFRDDELKEATVEKEENEEKEEKELEQPEEQVFGEQPEVGSTIVIQETTADDRDRDRSTRRSDTADDGRLSPRARDEDDQQPCPNYLVGGSTVAVDRPPETSDMSNQTLESDSERIPGQLTTTAVAPLDKYQQEEAIQSAKLREQADSGPTENVLDIWTEQVALAEDHQTGQFSDNFDETVCQQNLQTRHSSELVKQSFLIDTDNLVDIQSEPLIDQTDDVTELSAEEKSKLSVDQKSSSSIEESSTFAIPAEELEEEASTDAASTREFLDTERRVLIEESGVQRLDQDPSCALLRSEIIDDPRLTSSHDQQGDGAQPRAIEEEMKEEANDNADDQNAIAESSSELSVSEPTFIEKTEVVVSGSSVTVSEETKCPGYGNDDAEPAAVDTDTDTDTDADTDAAQEEHDDSQLRAPLATPDDETSDVSNACDSESREETLTTSTSVVSSPNAKGATKTKKKKIEGVAGNDASPNLTPRTKKTKKSKKSELEKENISVNSNLQESSMHPVSRQMHLDTIDFSNEDDLSNVNVKSLTQNYVSESNRHEQERSMKEKIATGVSIKQLKSSFNKFDALSKKTVLHVRSIDAGKVQQQLNAVGQNGDTNANCRSCGKVVFQMEQTKAEGLVWHKNCFRCVQCSKQLNVDNYESHESTLYCKPHFKELFQPKPVEESEQPVRPRKPEMIIRENEPKELPPDVVRASDKPDLGLEELSSLNVKSRFQVFEKAGTEANEIERSPSQIAVKRSPSILSKLAKFQAKGMDIGVADESLNGIPYEESSESEEEEETEEAEELDSEIVKAKRATRERPISFSKMDDIKNRWETTSQQGRREVQREARKEEIAGIRSRLFMGKQGKMKEMYQQAVAGSERVTKINAAEEIQHSATHARSIKERFERGEPIAVSDDETDSKPKPEKADEEVIAAGISRKSRSMFLELDASAAKTGRPVTPVNPKTPAETPRRARDAFMGRQVSDDVVRSSDTAEEVHGETSDISNKFKFFESYKEPEKQRKQFRITPPRDGQVKMDSPEREIYRDPDVVRADDRADKVVHTDTARKMLSIFRQMEENASKKEVPNGPKPLKRFTPPPEDKYAKPTASDSEEDEEEEGDETEGEDSGEERDPNYVRASDKVEDEFLKQAQHAARAKSLCAKFEHWEETDGKTATASSQHIAEMEIAQSTGEQPSIESASSLRARFESLGSQQTESPRTAKVKVNRFVEIQASCTDVCESCEKKVYPLEKVETNNKIFHKQCFRCLQCNCVLRMDTFTLNNGKLYCIPHFKQLFITRGNYDEGFGVDPHRNKWSTATSNATSSAPIAVSNGDL
ncbi:uncharacterized protein LOC143374242 isoform X4 [Andrena cerasifolii]|uniref:uncharacterized protein LOC143374242 isoform X4 n=1 Tax=Andrena cerasifolii TaxID=2819439 RepID=UPI004037C032